MPALTLYKYRLKELFFATFGAEAKNKRAEFCDYAQPKIHPETLSRDFNATFENGYRITETRLQQYAAFLGLPDVNQLRNQLSKAA